MKLNENKPDQSKAPDGMVCDRKTGEYYDPKVQFDKLMNKPEILAMFQRLKAR